MSPAGRRSSQQHRGLYTDQHGGIVVLTVCGPLLLLNGCCNNRSHSSPAGSCSRSQLLYLHGQMRGVSARVSSGLCVLCCLQCVCVCVWPGCALWPCCHQRSLSELHMGEPVHDDTVMASCCVAPSSAAMLVGLHRPPTSRGEREKRDKWEGKQASSAREGGEANHIHAL